MNVAVFYTADRTDPCNLAILSATGGRYAHCGLRFVGDAEDVELMRVVLKTPGWTDGLRADPDGLYRWYIESISRRDERTGQSGVRGPYPWGRVEEWHAKGWRCWFGKDWNPRRVALQELDVDDRVADAILARAAWAVGRIPYAHLQILCNWRGLRFGAGVAVGSRSRKKWTCVELVVRCLPPCRAVGQLGLGEWLFDEYVPSGRRGAGLYELMAEGGQDG